MAQQLQASEWCFGAACEASKSGLSSFGVGHVTVSVMDMWLNIIIEFDFGLIWHHSSKTSPKLVLLFGRNCIIKHRQTYYNEFWK